MRRPGSRRARHGASRSAASTAACSRSTPASDSTRSSSAASTPRAAGPTASGPGDLAFTWTVVRALVDHRFRYESALEVEGLGRAAFALIANCSPYTYAGALGLRFVPGASFEGGLDIVAPIEVRPRAVPRLATQALRGRPGADDVLVGHDLDRIVIRCDVPLPVQVDGEDIGDTQEAEIVAVRDALTVLT